MLRRTLGLSMAIVLLAGSGLVVRELMRPASITVDEPQITLEPGDVRAVQAHTSGGLPFDDAPGWTITPPWLGTINARGEFHAGLVSGTGTLKVRFGSASANVAVTIACPKEAQISGVRFEVSCGKHADTYVDVIAYGGPNLAATVERETNQIAGHLGMAAERRFRVYYFGSPQGFASGVSELGRDFSVSPPGSEGDAVYFDTADAIAIDQSADPLMQTTGALRHELVHRFLRQFVGYANVDEIPTWLNEGWAFIEESNPTDRLRIEAQLVSASMAHLGRLPSLRTMTNLHDWNARTGIEGLYQYYAAAQATQLLLADIQLAGLHRILKRVRDGDSFREAFSRSVSKTTYGDFEDAFSERVARLVDRYPGMVAVSGTPYGPGTTVIAYGLKPDASATMRATGPMERELSGNIDPYGAFVRYVGPEFAAGEYVVTLDADGQRLSVMARR